MHGKDRGLTAFMKISRKIFRKSNSSKFFPNATTNKFHENQNLSQSHTLEGYWLLQFEMLMREFFPLRVANSIPDKV